MAAGVGIGGTVGSIFNELFPRVMISTTNTAYNLTVKNTASPPYTPQGDDGRRGRLAAGCHRLPGVDVQGLPGRLSAPRVGGADTAAPEATPSEAMRPTRGRQNRRRRRDRLTGRRSDQSPGLLCMMPPSAKIVVAVM